MGKQFDTEMGGQQRQFATTCWTVIVNSQTTDGDQKKAILDELIQKYWKPVCCYINRKGYDNEKAKDLTQGFFAEIVWGRDLIQSADPQKGRFRNFLLTALKRYLTDTYRYEHSQKRMPSKEIFSYDTDNGYELADIDGETNAEEVFNSVWLMELLKQSFAEVQKDMEEDGMGKYWALFEFRCVEPILKDSKPRSLKKICHTLNIDDITKASSMIVTVKRRVKKTIIGNLHKIVGSKSDLEDEITALIGKMSI